MSPLSRRACAKVHGGMARSYAQLAAIIFAIIGVGGFITGDAGHVARGQASGNFDGVALHLTYARDVVDLVVAAVFAYAGFVARQPLANSAVLAVSGFLLALAVIGFITGDTDSGSRSIASLHFPVAINILDLIAGGLGVLSALASIDEPERAPA